MNGQMNEPLFGPSRRSLFLPRKRHCLCFKAIEQELMETELDVQMTKDGRKLVCLPR